MSDTTKAPEPSAWLHENGYDVIHPNEHPMYPTAVPLYTLTQAAEMLEAEARRLWPANTFVTDSFAHDACRFAARYLREQEGGK